MRPIGPNYDQQLDAACGFIREKDDFLVVSHVNPDGDAISSTLAVGWMLQQLNKRFVLINEGSIPQKFDYLWGYERITDFSTTQDVLFRNVISVDCADFSRMGEVTSLFGDSVELLNIDHHPTNDGFGTVQLIQPDAAATAEILYDLSVRLDIPWTKELAECVYTGLLADTGGFRYSNTSPKVMNIASEMLKYGVIGSVIAEVLLERTTMSQIRVLKKALDRLEFSPDGRIAWMTVTLTDLAETGASSEDLEGLVNYPRNIEGVEVGILFKESNPSVYKASLRSAGKVDVSRIAEGFGGGGHVRASGCTLSGTNEEAVERIVKEVGKELA